MLKLIYLVVLSWCLGVVPVTEGSVSEVVEFLTGHNHLLNCISEFDEKCLSEFGQGSVTQLMHNPEIPLDSHISLERLEAAKEDTESFSIWNLSQLGHTLDSFLHSHALKVRIGNMVGRAFESRTKPGSLELTVDAITKAKSVGSGKSQRLYKVVIPLVLGFKVTGMIIFGIFAVKLFLVKATLVANAALLVAGFVVLKKLYDHGMNMLNVQHHSYGTSHHAIPSYYHHKEEPNFSGYGYYGNSYDTGNSLGSFSSAVGGDGSNIPDVLPGGNDLQGQYSHHAIAMAALNKTLQNRPKRRWSYKWT